MKRYISKFIIGFVVATAVGSCTAGFEELNINPNEPSKVPTSYLLTSAQKQLADHSWDEWFNGRFGLQCAQYWASNVYSDESRYAFRTSITNSYWIYFYSGRDVVNDGTPNGGGAIALQRIIEINNDDPEFALASGNNDNQIAVARIMKAWLFQMITDIWGDVPYSEALKGNETPSPAYDTQKTIYLDLLKELKGASNQIKLGEPGFTSGDLIYGGDMLKWKKFANSLRLRVALRMSDVVDADVQTAVQNAITEATTEGVFESNEDNALLRYLGGVPNNNPLNEDRKTRTDFAVSNTLIDALQDRNDPRISRYADLPVNGEVYVGMPYGLDQDNAGAIPNGDVSQPSGARVIDIKDKSFKSSDVLKPESPYVYMDYAEVKFAIAEAIARGYMAGDAATQYNDAITASMNYWGITENAVINAYLNQGNVTYNPGNFRKSIGEQKWLAMYMQGIQGWIEWRRLDFGILQLPADGTLNGAAGIPKRRAYPSDEQSLNGANYAAAVANQGPDNTDTPVWWDVN